MSDYLDGELTARARARVRRHIHECPECRRVLLGLQRMLGLLQGVPAAGGSEEAPDITSAVRRRLHERADE
jgi:anti-sigma factor RsiW